MAQTFPAAASTNTPLHILLIEDSEADAFLLTRYFERAGLDLSLHRIETAEEMRAELTDPEKHWDVVLADYNLPTFSAPAGRTTFS